MLKTGRDINAKDESGRTAFFLACMAGKVNTARELLVRGADAWAVDKAGRTAEHVATARCRDFIKEYKATGAVPDVINYHTAWGMSGELKPLEGKRASEQRSRPTSARSSKSFGSELEAHKEQHSAPTQTHHRRNSLEAGNPFARLDEKERKLIFGGADMDVHISGDVGTARRIA
mmetsp:Transcript_13483/g.26475  ORF Transcript_13483/g.26475 Transcript_13483/m.26475 type:complete len:175 (+) Transcript_13483:344-868(+)